MANAKTFRVVLIKPSRYDDDGYVVQWRRSAIPSNSLATLYGLTMQARDNRVLGEDVEIELVAHDETNTILPVKQIIRDIKRAGSGFVGLVGVQSNQFPRALHLSKQFRDAGLPVVIGGFHAAGCLSMLPKIPPEVQQAIDMGVVIYAGEAEGRLGDLFKDIYNGTTKPIYNYLNDLPDISGSAAVPFLPREVVNRTCGNYTSFDAGRGCPFQCSFCTIINVQGRVSRRRTPDDVEAIVRANLAQGIKRFLLTDDNFARNKDWEPILDRLIEIREREGHNFRFFIQVDTLCHKIPNFIEKCTRAGAHWIYIGLENINPEALMAAKKRQNKIWEYRNMLQEWKKHGASTYVGYILGFPPDTPESIARDVEILKRELPIEIVEFFCLTPLPGSEDHQVLYNKGAWMDPDLNKYELGHVVAEHPNMTIAEWQAAYWKAWRQYYNDEHMETVMRRAAAYGKKVKKVIWPIMWFYASIMYEHVHPVEGGYFRYKVRTQRRPDLPLESPLIFYPRRAWEIASTAWHWLQLYRKLDKMAERIEADPHKREYKDLALTPTTEEESVDTLDMFKVHGDSANKFQRANIHMHKDEEVAPQQTVAAE